MRKERDMYYVCQRGRPSERGLPNIFSDAIFRVSRTGLIAPGSFFRAAAFLWACLLLVNPGKAQDIQTGAATSQAAPTNGLAGNPGPPTVQSPDSAGAITLFQQTNNPALAASSALTAATISAANAANLQASQQNQQIRLEDSGAVADFGPHKVSFAPNLNTPWAVNLTMFDGQKIPTDIAGIYYYDSASDKIVLIGTLKDTIGELLPPNQVIYTNAFDGVAVDVLFSYTQNSLEQDLVIRKQLPDPAKLNLSPASVRLVVITEMLTPVDPVTIPTTVDLSAWNQAAGIQGPATLSDENIFFKTMAILPGRAFTWGDDTTEIPVGKAWVKLDNGHSCLVESTPYPLIKPQLDALPPLTAQLSPRTPQSFKSLLAEIPVRSPAKRRAAANTGPRTFRIAQAAPRQPGVVLDYLIANTAILNVLFGAPSTNKIGFAEVGQTANDYWNGYHLPSQSVGAITNLFWSNTNASGAGITVTNATGEWGNGVGDGMYGPYAYASGTNITLGITNLANGTYDFYIYGHGPTTNGNSIFQLTSGTNSYPTKGTTIWGAGWNSTNWEQGQQYVVYKSVPVLSNQPIVLTVSVDTPGYAIINGIQIVPSGATTNSVPISSLFNINFGNYTTNKVGFAAVGLTTNDFWTGLYFPNIANYAATNLEWSDGYTSHFGVTVTNAPGDWNNGVNDGMFGTYVYLSTGGNINISLTNIANGIYDFYVYGHSPSDSANSIFQLTSGTNSYGPKGTTIWGSGWNSTNWEESQQYVVFRGVQVVTNQSVVITVLPDSANYAIINGLQVVLPTPSVDTDSNGDGIPDWWDLKYGLNPHATLGNDSFGVPYWVDYIEGRDPNVGTTPDTGGVIQLNVFTPLK